MAKTRVNGKVDEISIHLDLFSVFTAIKNNIIGKNRQDRKYIVNPGNIINL